MNDSGLVRESNALVERAEAEMLNLPQVECPLFHRFVRGMYVREIRMRKGLGVIGHEHKTAHWNVIIAGRARVMMNGVEHVIQAPHAFISEPGVRKVLLIEEDMIWQTIHPNPDELRSIEKLEELLIVKSESYLAHHADLKRLLNAPSHESKSTPI